MNPEKYRRLSESGFVTRFRMRLGCKEGSAKSPQVCLLHIEDGFADADTAGRDAVGIAVEAILGQPPSEAYRGG